MQELYDWIKYVDEWMLPWNTIGWVCIIVFSMAVIALSVGVIRLYTKGKHNWDN